MCLREGSASHLDGTNGFPASDTAALEAPRCFPGRGTTWGPQEGLGFTPGKEGPPSLGAESLIGVPRGHVTWDGEVARSHPKPHPGCIGDRRVWRVRPAAGG